MIATAVSNGYALCSWANAERLVVYPTSHAIVSFGAQSPSIKTFSIGAVVHPREAYQYVLSASTVQIAAANNPVLPSASIIAKPGLYLGRCDDLVLSGSRSSGSGGRALTAAWTIASYTCPTTACTEHHAHRIKNVTRILSAVTSTDDEIIVPKALLYEGATLIVNLTVQNWATVQSSRVSVTITIEDAVKPTVNVIGAQAETAMRSKRSNTVRLNGYGMQPTCGGDALGASAMQFTWSASVQPPNAPALSALSSAQFSELQKSTNPLNIVIAPFQLEAGALYRFTLTGCMKSAPSVCNEGAADIKVLQSDLRATIFGGNRQVGSSATSLRLDGSQSKDPDDSASPMTYLWTCFVKGDSSTPCTNAVSGGLLLTAPMHENAIMSIAPSRMAQGTFYVFTLLASKAGVSPLPDRSDTEYVTIEIVQGQKPGVTLVKGISMVSDRGGVGGETRINPDGRVVVYGDLDIETKARLISAEFDVSSITGDGPTATAAVCGTAWKWSWASCSIAAAADCVPIDADEAELTKIASTQLTSAALVLRRGSLVPKTRYTFRLTATESGALSGMATRNKYSATTEVTVVLNSPPGGGKVTVKPSVGEVLVTEFIATTSLWTDDIADLPLRYLFVYSRITDDGGAMQTTRVSEVTLDNEKKIAALPEGSGVVYAIAFDALGAEGRAQTNVLVKPMAVVTLPPTKAPTPRPADSAALTPEEIAAEEAAEKSAKKAAQDAADAAKLLAVERAANATHALLTQAAAVSDPSLTMQTVSAVMSVLVANSASEATESSASSSAESKKAVGEVMGQLLSGLTAAKKLMEKTPAAMDQLASGYESIASGAGSLDTDQQNAVVDALLDLSSSAISMSNGSDATPMMLLSTALSQCEALGAILSVATAEKLGTSTRRRLAETAAIKTKVENAINSLGTALLQSAINGDSATTVVAGELALSLQRGSVSQLSTVTTASPLKTAQLCESYSMDASFDWPANAAGSSSLAESGVGDNGATLSVRSVQYGCNMQTSASGAQERSHRRRLAEEGGNTTQISTPPTRVTTTTSPATSLTVGVLDGSTRQGVRAPRDAVTPLVRMTQVVRNTTLPNTIRECAYLHTSSGEWRGDGMVLVAFRIGTDGRAYQICDAMHLTDFAGAAGDAVPEMTFADPVGDAHLLKTIDETNIFIPIFLGCMLLVFIVSQGVAKLIDWVHLKRARRDFVLLGDFTIKADPLDHTLEAFDKGVGVKSMTPDPKSILTVSNLLDHLIDAHDWINVFFAPAGHHYSRTTRVGVLSASFFTGLAVTALFYGQEPERIDRVIVAGVISAIAMWPSSNGFRMSFEVVSSFKEKISSGTQAAKEKTQRKEVAKRNKKRLSDMAKAKKNEKKERKERHHARKVRRTDRKARRKQREKQRYEQHMHREAVRRAVEERKGTVDLRKRKAAAEAAHEVNGSMGALVLLRSKIDRRGTRFCNESTSMVFSDLDLDHDGFINEAELFAAFPNASACDIRLIFAEFDDGDGKISEEEMGHMRTRMKELQVQIEVPDAVIHMSVNSSSSDYESSTGEEDDIGLFGSTDDSEDGGEDGSSAFHPQNIWGHTEASGEESEHEEDGESVTAASTSSTTMTRAPTAISVNPIFNASRFRAAAKQVQMGVRVQNILRSTSASSSSEKRRDLTMDDVTRESTVCVYDAVWVQLGMVRLTGISIAPSMAADATISHDYGVRPKDFNTFKWLEDREREAVDARRWNVFGIAIESEKARKFMRPALICMDTTTLRIYELNTIPQIVLLLLVPIILLLGATIVTVGFILAITKQWYHVGITVVIMGLATVGVGGLGAIGGTSEHWVVLVIYAIVALALAFTANVAMFAQSDWAMVVIGPIWASLMPFQHNEVQRSWMCCGMGSADDSTYECPPPRTAAMLTASDDPICGITALSTGFSPFNKTALRLAGDWAALHNGSATITYSDDAIPCIDVAACYMRAYYTGWNPLFWAPVLLCTVTAVCALIVAVRPTGGFAFEEDRWDEEDEDDELGDESEDDDDQEEKEEEEAQTKIDMADMVKAAREARATSEAKARASLAVSENIGEGSTSRWNALRGATKAQTAIRLVASAAHIRAAEEHGAGALFLLFFDQFMTEFSSYFIVFNKVRSLVSALLQMRGTKCASLPPMDLASCSASTPPRSHSSSRALRKMVRSRQSIQTQFTSAIVSPTSMGSGSILHSRR